MQHTDSPSSQPTRAHHALNADGPIPFDPPQGGAKTRFPLRAKPDFYRQILHTVLARAQGQKDAFAQVCAIGDEIEHWQAKALDRPLTDPESQALRLRTLRDIRTSLIALSVGVAGRRDMSETHVRRTRNLPYLQWRIEKEILCLHWGISLLALDERQVRSGLRMPRFLAEAMENEGLN